MHDELKISVHKSKDIIKTDQDSKGKRIREIFSSNSGNILRGGKEYIKDYIRVSSYEHNKKKSHREGTNKYVFPKSLDITSGTYSSFDIGNSSSDNDELPIRTNQAKDRIKVTRDSKGIETSEIISRNSGKTIKPRKHFINVYRSTAQHNIVDITSLEAQASTNTAPQHYYGVDLITNTDTPRPISKTTPHNIQLTASSVVQSAMYKSIPNEHDTDPTDGTGHQ